MRVSQELGLQYVGWYHSHPRIKPLPSTKVLAPLLGTPFSLCVERFLFGIRFQQTRVSSFCAGRTCEHRASCKRS